MKSKSIILMAILLLALLSLAFVCASDNANNSDNKTQLNVSSEGPLELSVIINDIKTGSYYKGYDNETVKWMESLGHKKVFVSDDAFIVMSSEDASKLQTEYVNDAHIVEFIECTVLENHTLGDVKYPKDVLLVKDVRYMGKEIQYLQDN